MGRKRKAFLDTNTIIYFLEGADGFEILGEMKSFYYSFITEIELLSHGDEDQRKIILNFLKNGKQISINKKIIYKTIKLRKSKGLKIPDALIVASAEDIGADLYTSDKELVKKIDSLNVINLFDR